MLSVCPLYVVNVASTYLAAQREAKAANVRKRSGFLGRPSIAALIG